nr:zinc finger CCHC domain-containing protein 8 homolog [Leptinotarsa decemlineata]
MDTNKVMKRKSPSKSAVFELSDNDVSPDHSDSDCDQPKSKLIKTQTDFVDSVVLAFTKLENENNLETKLDKQTDEPVPKSIESDDVLPTISEVLQNKELEEGEVDENSGSPRPPLPATNNLDSENCLTITFSNENMSDFYKLKFLKFLETFIELEVTSEDKLSLKVKRDPLLLPTEWVVVDEVMDTNIAKMKDVEEKLCSPLPPTPLKSKKRKKPKKEKNLFVVDTQPQSGTNDNSCAKYSSKFNIEINEIVEEDTVKASAQTCFNCDENHALKDCPEQKNYFKINLRRQQFKAQKLVSRYHLEDEQKFSHLVPGKISDGLREALGLRKNQLPPYIYQMRLLGYPPGWLEEAKFIHSNLKMFDSEGKHVKEGSSGRSQGLNSDKIVDYPGFNVPIPKNLKDEFRQHQVPPYSEKYSKTVMLEYFANQVVNNNDNDDMDIETSVEMDVTEDLNCRPSLPSAVLDVKKTEVGAPSPSLTDLEKAKQNLLAELNDNSSSNPKSEENTSEIPDRKPSDSSEEINIPESKDLEPSEETSRNDTPQIEKESSETSSSSQISPVNISFNSVKDSSFGTPILKSNSSFSRLPKAENFMKDVSPVINFENLPNSTGKYEQMTNVLQKVRNTMKHLQNCKS